MKRSKIIPVLAVLAAAVFGFVLVKLIGGRSVALLDPKGMIASEQNWLLIASTLIMLSFGVPVILTLYFFVWRYREGADRPASDFNPEKTSSPNTLLAFAWGGP